MKIPGDFQVKHFSSPAHNLRQTERRKVTASGREEEVKKQGVGSPASVPNTKHVQEAHRAFGSGTLGSSYQKDNHI